MKHYCPVCNAPSTYAPVPSGEAWPKTNTFRCGCKIELRAEGAYTNFDVVEDCPNRKQ